MTGRILPGQILICVTNVGRNIQPCMTDDATHRQSPVSSADRNQYIHRRCCRNFKAGKILAIKDIGGYHLACRTDSVNSVNDIRKLKGREAKPFAVMFSSIDEILEYCKVNDKEKELLLSPARPLFCLKK